MPNLPLSFLLSPAYSGSPVLLPPFLLPPQVRYVYDQDFNVPPRRLCRRPRWTYTPEFIMSTTKTLYLQVARPLGIRYSSASFSGIRYSSAPFWGIRFQRFCSRSPCRPLPALTPVVFFLSPVVSSYTNHRSIVAN